ncbi:hypothetical protein CTA2_8425 [Colletotrichum tanaceti]|uniref:BTB domain-containing protein n=1 Tax=Colletotrichum tanaceti TaxID=1306861 RepID=A0A4U6XSJ3_9PEZI|nr:hypothetical protein CTA2_8425 [Colletotrichum tanaceti]TKW58864.1 hypothetical protein CTA1_8623 [Colletotrichum tanaceti]
MENTTGNRSGGEKAGDPFGCLEILAPQRMITLRAGDQELLVHENVLTQGSRYFQACLAGSPRFAESRTGTIAFHDVDPVTLRHYVNFAYHRAFFSGYAVPKSCNQPGGGSVASLARVYRLCDRFLNAALQWHVGTALAFVLDLVGRPRPPLGQGAPDLKTWIADYAEAYETLDGGDRAQQMLREKLLVSFFKHFPVIRLREHSQAVAHHPRFRFEVNRRFAILLRMPANRFLA